MSISEYKEELLDILSFAESVSLRDIKDYWNLSDNICLLDFRAVESIEPIYQSDQLKISKEKIEIHFQSLRKAKNFISFLLQSNRMPKNLAQKIVNIEEFYGLFNADEVLSILFKSERYEECQEYYCSHIPNFGRPLQARSVWQRSLARLGNYTRKMALGPEKFETYFSAMRYLWQKGDFSTALEIADKLDQRIDGLKAYQKCLFLNTKIRILRDTGMIRETAAQLEQYNQLLETVGRENPELFNDLNGKYLYNCSINCFVAGNFAKCISLCEESLSLRSEKYPDPYIRLREARCFIFQGKQKDYLALMKTIQFDELDNWAKSLYRTVQAEYYHFILGNAKKAESILRESNALESATGADTVYTNIALLYLYIECSKTAEIKRYLPTVKNYEHYIDGRLAVLTANLALDALSGKSIDKGVFEICKEFSDYPIFLFVSLFSLSKLFEKHDIKFPAINESISFGSGFSKKLLFAFSRKPHVIIVYSWWDADGKEDDENKTWVGNLNIALRKHGIISDIDKTMLDETKDSSKLINGNYDSYIVVLTEGFKARIEQKEGVLFKEYNVLLEILKHDPDRIILARRGENDRVSPKEIRFLTKLDLSSTELSKKRDKQLLGLIRRIEKIPYYDKSIPPIDEDIAPEPLKYKRG